MTDNFTLFVLTLRCSAFDDTARECSPLLRGATAALANVSVFAMVTVTSMPIKAFSLTFFQRYARMLEMSSAARKTAKVQGAAAFKDGPARGAAAAEASGSMAANFQQALDVLMPMLQRKTNDIMTRASTYCGLTFVARGDVTLSVPSGRSLLTYQGTLESLLLWHDGIDQEPRFLGTRSALPYEFPRPGAVSQLGAFGLLGDSDWLRLGVMCQGIDRETVPTSRVASIRLENFTRV